MLAFVGSAIHKSSEISTRNEEALISTYPVMSGVEVERRLDSLVGKIEGWQMSPDEYFATLAELDLLEKATRRNDGAIVNRNDYHANSMMMFRARALQNDLANKHSRGLPTSEIEAARDRHPNMLFGGDQVARGSELVPLGRAYLLIALLAAPIFFFLRLRREGLMVLPELAWRLPFWAVLWPVGLFKYPVNIDVREQARRFKQWLAALVSMLLGMSPVAMAHAKSGGGKLGGAEVVQVEQQGPTIRTIDPPAPQILPTLVVDGVTVNFSGWAHVQTSSNDGPELTMLKARFVVTDSQRNVEIFSQFDPLREGQPIDELWVSYGDSDLKVKVGHLFRSSAFSAPAPFLMETITAPSLPVSFFGTGVSVEGALNDNTSCGFDATGDSRAEPFSGQMFDRLDVSGSVKRTHTNGFIRLSAQHAGDLRVIMDGQHQFGPYRVRAAVHYRTDGDQVGGYVFLSRDLSDTVKVFTQFEMENHRLKVLAGLRYAVNDNLDFTAEASNDNGWRIRARGRF